MLLSMLLSQKMHLITQFPFLTENNCKRRKQKFLPYFKTDFLGSDSVFHVTEHEFGFGYWQLLPLPQQCEDGERSSEHEIPGNSF